jgi:sortase (surface protein transpeptidase)
VPSPRAAHRALVVAVVVLAVGGAGLLAAGFNAKPGPPRPAAHAAPTGPHSAAAASSQPAGRAWSARSEPTRITIPTIGVAAEIMPVGLDSEGGLQVPPLEQAQVAGWYSPGPSPGDNGNAVIVGHVDSYATGPAVFFRLGALRSGDTIQVTRQDRTVLRFAVDGVKSYPKGAFPTGLVYGPADQVQLRLVTCGGYFDDRNRSYPDNVIVFATLTAVVQSTKESVHS